MNRGNPGVVLVIIMLMIGGLYSIASVLLTSGNTIGELCRFLLVGGFVLCLAAPRAGFFVWLTFCGYNDLVKRLLVIGGRITQEDLVFVLGITPAMFGGIVTSLIVGGLMQSTKVSMREWRSLLIGILLMLLVGASAASGTGSGMNGVLQAMANEGLYALLMFVLPVIFRTSAEILSIWRYLVIVFLPVAIYGVIQQVFGFADFEVEYLLSGLTIEIKQLYTDDVRAFSTLNSPTALSVVTAVLAVSSLLLGFMCRGKNGRPVISRPAALFCFVAYTVGLIASTGRTSLVILPTALIATWCFLSRGRTKFFYVTAISAFLLLVASSGWLINHLEELNERALALGAPGSFMSRMVMVGTYWDRLAGFSNVLMNPEAWSLFGYGEAEDGTGRYYYHDPISEILMRYGAVTLIVVIGAVAFMLHWFHRQAWQIESKPDRQFASAMIALAFSILLISALSGSVMSVFPVNVFFWLACSAVIGLSRRSQTVPQPAALQPQPPHSLRQQTAT